MSKKRRMFDIEVPQDEPENFPAGKMDEKETRRGPMATAIAETVESSRDRARIEAQIRAENDALAQEHVRLKRAGLITDLIALDAIDADKLIRDRGAGVDEDLPELIRSIRDIGLSNPVRVEPSSNGRYELIQGWRRLSAYRALLQETGDEARWGRIPAGISAKGDQLEQLYRRMVDENLVRKDISFAEMAQLALQYAADPGTETDEPEKAVASLFKSAGYQKRTYIRHFITVMRALGASLRFSQEIPRALGLALAQRISDTPSAVPAIVSELDAHEDRSAKEELDILRGYAGQGAEPVKGRKSAARPTASKAKTTFQVARPEGSAKCTAANGRLEIRLPKDFSTIDRRRLELAVAELLQQID
ncbi:ParB N-terminal domain-containing protein [Paracoccus sp. Z330]|uniref:ParB N-terminal domain-containing protein n=1 Tax=Paracoccus onchidii TaxID=3017813 RepID=A0ABT4ZFA6_9RHOB|nr:ParB N-terminal domain-containing protein [Paracoccus onchidii]MDB6177638.1 ParB N-terminal domain-containing protein [Paracoccus onchidii]